jgi:hypothetical protein
MSEQINGVESFDPQAALFAMNQVIYRASIESWGQRLFNAAFGSHSALRRQKPADTRVEELAALEVAKDQACDYLAQFRAHNMGVMLFDHEAQRWSRIIGFGYDSSLLSLKALLENVESSKLVGPSTVLTCVQMPILAESGPGWPDIDPSRADLLQRSSDFLKFLGSTPNGQIS